MNRKGLNRITVFEHQSLYCHKGENRITEELLLALQLFYGDNGVPYFSLLHKGVKFCEFVGVLQIGKTVIEILPKADKTNDTETWRKVLIGMLQRVGNFEIHAPTSGNLKLKSNSILDLYFEWFVIETELLLHNGLIKHYRKEKGNCKVLKGALQFSEHIQQNIIHHEKFYIKYTVYDVNHPLNCILYTTLLLLKQINTNSSLNSRIGNLLLNFPRLSVIRSTESFFDKIQYSRKSNGYKKAIDIARLILLNYHPDITRGKNNVLALMFDMNVLWERFAYISLRKAMGRNVTIESQSKKEFWKPDVGRKQKMIADIIINRAGPNCIVLDTKWKNLGGANPSPDDLRQLYVYSKFHGNAKAALLFPGEEMKYTGGKFFDESDNRKTNMDCGILTIKVETNIGVWQKLIAQSINDNLMQLGANVPKI